VTKFGQVYLTTAYPGTVKAWHFHKKQDDNVTAINGMAKIVLYGFFSILIGILSASFSTIALTIAVIGIAAIIVISHPRNGVLLLFLIAPFYGLLKRLFPTGATSIPAITLDILFSIIFIGIIFRAKKQEISSFLRKPIVWLILLFLIIGFLQLFNSYLISWGIGLRGFKTTFYYILAVPVGFLFLREEKDIKKIYKILILASVISATYGIRQFLFPTLAEREFVAKYLDQSFLPGAIRSFSTFICQYSFGMFLTITNAIVIIFLLNDKNIKRRFIYSIIILIQWVAALMSLSRGTYITIFSLFLFIWFTTRGVDKKVKMVSIFVIGLILIGYLLINIPIFSHITSRFHFLKTSSFRSRYVLLWPISLELLSKHPFGIGVGNVRPVGEGIYVEDLPFGRYETDNQFINVALESGIQGMILFTIVLLGLIKIGVQNFRRPYNQFIKINSQIMLCIIFATILFSTIGNILTAYPINFLFWFFCGVLIKLDCLNKFTEKQHISKNKQNEKIPQQ